MKETGLNDGYLVGFFYPPEKNLPIEKVIMMSRLVNKCVIKETVSNIGSFTGSATIV